MRSPTGSLLWLVLAFPGPTHADRGSIPFTAGVQIFEPNQRAMLAWNGREEILLLSTDLRASAPTKVLEVLPLPAEPTVKKGDVEVFRKATALINSRQVNKLGSHSRSEAGGRRAPPAGEITFHKRIGAHDVSVTHVLDNAGFVRWVEKYLKSQGVAVPRIPRPLRDAVNDYLRDGFKWFVFDVVSLGTEPRTNDAIQYQFKSDCVYYPLRITRAETGSTVVDLLVLTPQLLRSFSGIPIQRVELPHDPIAISRRELRGLSTDMDDLLGHRDDMKLRIWRVRGRLSEFDQDLIAR